MLALVQLKGLTLAQKHQLLEMTGSAKQLYEQRHTIAADAPKLKNALAYWDDALAAAERELQYDAQHNIRTLCIGDEAYPARLRQCADAPLALFYVGTADLNQKHIVSIVGTRHSTPYGHDLIRRLMADLRLLCPQTLIVSGLAYGIDICAHRQTLEQGMETVGVLAHGLDDLYPPRHRDTANQMARQGGLLTEYFTHTRPVKANFVQRNRIVAGISDACIVVESAAKGGALITATIAQDYNRDVFAFPGRVGDPYSEGCNRLIRDCRAALITSAEDLVNAMHWEGDAALSQARREGIERPLFPDLTEKEALVVGLLREDNDQQLSLLSVKTNIPIGELSALLFQLEMRGIVQTLAGGKYHLFTI